MESEDDMGLFADMMGFAGRLSDDEPEKVPISCTYAYIQPSPRAESNNLTDIRERV